MWQMSISGCAFRKVGCIMYDGNKYTEILQLKLVNFEKYLSINQNFTYLERIYGVLNSVQTCFVCGMIKLEYRNASRSHRIYTNVYLPFNYMSRNYTFTDDVGLVHVEISATALILFNTSILHFV